MVATAIILIFLLWMVIEDRGGWTWVHIEAITYILFGVATIVTFVLISLFFPPLKLGKADPAMEARRQFVMSVMMGEEKVDRLIERAEKGHTEFTGPPEVEEVMRLGNPFPIGYVTLDDCYYVVAKTRVAGGGDIRVRSKGKDVGITIPWRPGIGKDPVDVTGIVHLPEVVDARNLKADIVEDALFIKVSKLN
jgi:hypothetical protein